MSAGMPLASWKSQIFESVLGFLPDWVQITVLALIVLALVASWVVGIKRKIAHRRAEELTVRGGQRPAGDGEDRTVRHGRVPHHHLDLSRLLSG